MADSLIQLESTIMQWLMDIADKKKASNYRPDPFATSTMIAYIKVLTEVQRLINERLLNEGVGR